MLFTYHFCAVQPGVLYRDGNRSLRQFARSLRRSRCKTVVTLVDDSEITQEPFAAESELCRARGIAFERIPIPLGGWPTSEQVGRFLSLAADTGGLPLLVHC